MFFLYVLISLMVIYLVARWRWRRLRIKNINARYVFITGCDSGFGNLIAKKLDGLGLQVFAGCLTEKGQEELRKATSDRVTVLPLDVTDNASISRAYETVKSKLPDDKGLWGIINNAGVFSTLCVMDWIAIEEYERVMRVNVFGMVEVTRIFLPLVRKTKGRIINTTSISGRIALGSAPYVASKYAAEGFSDMLRRELYSSGVSVHIIEPGGFRTNMVSLDYMTTNMKKAFNSLAKDTKDFYGEAFLTEMVSRTSASFNLALSNRLHMVADAYTDALTAKFPKARYLVGYDANVVYPLLWNLPEWVSDFLIANYFYPIPVALRSEKWWFRKSTKKA